MLNNNIYKKVACRRIDAGIPKFSASREDTKCCMPEVRTCISSCCLFL